MCAVTERYKLVYSVADSPWLFDLKNDPEELNNLFGRPEHKKLVLELTRALAEYCEAYADDRREQGRIKTDMEAVLA